MRYSTILFDVDGTLFDYDRAETAALQRTLASHGIGYRDELLGAYRAINRELWTAFERGELAQDDVRSLRFARLLESCDGHDGDPHAMGEEYLDHLSERGDLLRGARELLESIDGAFRMAVITNGIARVQHSRLDRSGLRPFFEAVVISAEVGSAKPDPGIFDVAFERVGNPDREDVLMIGDSLSSDIRGAVDYGIDACWIRPAGTAAPEGGSGARYEIEDLDELRALLVR